MASIIPLFISHRGCPHHCSFCNQESITGHRELSLTEYKDNFTEEINSWLERFRTPDPVEVAFYGGSFTCLPEDEQYVLLSVVQPFMQSGRVSGIRLSTRPDCLSENIVSFLKDLGVKKVELGVQSLDNKVLRKSGRGHLAEDSINSIHLLKKAGLEVGVQLMVGLPGESSLSFLSGIRLLGKLKPDFVRLYPVVVVRHSQLERQYLSGDYRVLSLNRAIALSKLFLQEMRAYRIPVIRIGLQPSKELESQLVAGPYHPSFGELVESRIWLQRIRRYFRTVPADVHVILKIADRDLSTVLGHKKNNMTRLEELGLRKRLTIEPDKKRKRGDFEFIPSSTSVIDYSRSGIS